MRWLNLTLIVLLVLLQARLWFGDGGMHELSQLKRMIELQSNENKELSQRNQSLAAEIHDLRNGTDALEERARSELGLVGADEEFFQIAEKQ